VAFAAEACVTQKPRKNSDCVTLNKSHSHYNLSISRRREASMLTVAEASRRLGLKEGTIRLWIYQRKLGHVKLGRCVRVPESEIDRLVRENLMPATRRS
jgi:excisionase family DNA binding protein